MIEGNQSWSQLIAKYDWSRLIHRSTKKCCPICWSVQVHQWIKQFWLTSINQKCLQCTNQCQVSNDFHWIPFQIGLAVGDIESVQKNARLKRLAMQVCLLYTAGYFQWLFNNKPAFHNLSIILSRASELGSPTNPPWAPGSNKTWGKGSLQNRLIAIQFLDGVQVYTVHHVLTNTI